MPKKELPLVDGIRISYRFKGQMAPRANFTMDHGRSSEPTFLTSPRIRELIAPVFKRRKEIGFMQLKFHPQTNTLNWHCYYPFRDVGEKLARNGIAQELEKRVLLRVKRQFPEIKTIRHSFLFEDERKEHLAKRGLFRRQGISPKQILTPDSILETGYSFRRGMRLLRKKINRDKKKAALKPRPR